MKTEEIVRIAKLAGYSAVCDPDDPDRNGKFLPGGRANPLQPARVHVDPRGALFELWRESWGPQMDRAGRIRQAYISITHPDTVKGWHLHCLQTDRFVVVRGRIIVATFDLRKLGQLDEPGHHFIEVEEHVLNSDLRPATFVIPPGVAHGWYNPGPQDAWVLNLCSEEYDGTDEWRRPADSMIDRRRGDGPFPMPGIAYDWRCNRDG